MADVAAENCRLEVVDQTYNQETGCRSFRVRAIEVDADGKKVGEGPIATYGIELNALTNTYQGNCEQFLIAEAKDKEIMRYVAARQSAPQAESLVGQQI